jgi:hypothetical protein
MQTVPAASIALITTTDASWQAMRFNLYPSIFPREVAWKASDSQIRRRVYSVLLCVEDFNGSIQIKSP